MSHPWGFKFQISNDSYNHAVLVNFKFYGVWITLYSAGGAAAIAYDESARVRVRTPEKAKNNSRQPSCQEIDAVKISNGFRAIIVPNGCRLGREKMSKPGKVGNGR